MSPRTCGCLMNELNPHCGCERPVSAAPKTRLAFFWAPVLAAVAMATAWMMLHGTRF